MTNIHGMILTAILVSTALGACVTDARQEPIDQSDLVIRSQGDLNSYLRTARNSPLDVLSEPAKQRFLGGLVFGDSGLGSFGILSSRG